MSKRLNLREFQQNVIDRLQASAKAGERASTLGVQVGDAFWLVDMADISEVLPVPILAPVALTHSWYWGLANVRGNLYSLVDLGEFEGGGGTERGGSSRVLLISPRYGFSTGLVVTRVLGLRNTRDWKKQEENGQLVYTDDQGQAWRKLNMSQLLERPDFMQVGI
ncbi:MAG: chemotaxis protein CheW [Nitrosomonadales bacterium]|nr:chemotaxis protein CheW [Nitrosomonadales bacterium]